MTCGYWHLMACGVLLMECIQKEECVCVKERERCVYVCVVCTQYKYMYLQCGVSVSQLLQVESEMLSVQSDQLLSRVHH